MKQSHKTLLVWLVFVLIVVAIWSVFSGAAEKHDQTKFAELLSAIDKGEVQEVRIQETSKGFEFTGTYKAGGKFTTLGVLDEGVRKGLQDAYGKSGTTYVIEPREGGTVWLLLIQLLPMALIFLVLLFLMRQIGRASCRERV